MGSSTAKLAARTRRHLSYLVLNLYFEYRLPIAEDVRVVGAHDGPDLVPSSIRTIFCQAVQRCPV